MIAVIIPLGQAHDHTQGTATGNDGCLVDRVRRGFMDRHDCVASLMISGHFLFIFGHDHRLAFGAHHHLVFGIFKFLHSDQPLATTCGQQGSFVHKVGEVGTGETRRSARDHAAIDIRCQRNLFHMYGKDFDTPINIRARHNYLTVETARTQQGRVKNVRTVGRGNDDDAFIGFKTVHFDQ